MDKAVVLNRYVRGATNELIGIAKTGNQERLDRRYFEMRMTIAKHKEKIFPSQEDIRVPDWNKRLAAKKQVFNEASNLLMNNYQILLNRLVEAKSAAIWANGREKFDKHMQPIYEKVLNDLDNILKQSQSMNGRSR